MTGSRDIARGTTGGFSKSRPRKIRFSRATSSRSIPLYNPAFYTRGHSVRNLICVPTTTTTTTTRIPVESWNDEESGRDIEAKPEGRSQDPREIGGRMGERRKSTVGILRGPCIGIGNIVVRETRGIVGNSRRTPL